MGLSSKQVSIDSLDWASNVLKSGALDVPKRPRQQQQQSVQLNCPRCNSTNTKFCYYNNYNRSQPRHFCKSCRRHWTKGGTLRNVPIGGRRNNKRLKTTDNRNSGSSSNNSSGSSGDISFVQQPQQQHPLAFEDQKNISEILYQTLLQSQSLQPADYINTNNDGQSNNGFSGSALSLPSILSTSSSFFNNNPSFLFSSFTDRFQSSNVCDYNGETETSEKPTITANLSWKLPNASNLMDSYSNWSWDDLNTLISNDLMKQPWDDFQMEEQGI